MSQKNISKIISFWKTEIISSVVILICLLLAIFFPTQGIFQEFSASFFFFLILPILYVKFILRKKLSAFGLNVWNLKTGFFWAIGMLLLSALLIFIFIHFFNFANNYLIPSYLAQNFGIFLLYELVLVNFILFIQEFFFKGFILSLFTEKIGFLAIIIQTLIFVLFLILTNTLSWQLAPFIILSLAGGVVAYKSRSFIYSYAMSLIFILFLDAYIIHIFK